MEVQLFGPVLPALEASQARNKKTHAKFMSGLGSRESRPATDFSRFLESLASQTLVRVFHEFELSLGVGGGSVAEAGPL